LTQTYPKGRRYFLVNVDFPEAGGPMFNIISVGGWGEGRGERGEGRGEGRGERGEGRGERRN
jgi:hypothetical protein